MIFQWHNSSDCRSKQNKIPINLLTTLKKDDLIQKQAPEVFYKKGVIKKFAKFKENTCAKAAFLIKLQASAFFKGAQLSG